ncbi:hypothetical protein BGW80DRAFT_311456 [Lactifluus volemus]|nr:hypothetical protein BGW80DRAFT_311456 [Lactifluus volemus]
MVPFILRNISMGRLGERHSVKVPMDPKKASHPRRNSFSGHPVRLSLSRASQRRPDSLPAASRLLFRRMTSLGIGGDIRTT